MIRNHIKYDILSTKFFGKDDVGVLTRAPMGYFWTLPADGMGAFRPLAICQITGPILDPKRHLIAPGLNVPNMLQNFIWMSLMMTHVWSKSIFYNLPLLASPGKAATTNWNKADGTTWIVSWILLNTLLSLMWPCVKSRSSKVTRSKRQSQNRYWVWVVWCLENFEKKEVIISPSFQNFQNYKILDSRFIPMFNLHVLLKTIGSILKTELVTTIPAHHYFSPKLGEHDVIWRH